MKQQQFIYVCSANNKISVLTSRLVKTKRVYFSQIKKIYFWQECIWFAQSFSFLNFFFISVRILFLMVVSQYLIFFYLFLRRNSSFLEALTLICNLKISVFFFIFHKCNYVTMYCTQLTQCCSGRVIFTLFPETAVHIFLNRVIGVPFTKEYLTIFLL